MKNSTNLKFSREGNLYKTIELYGASFEIKYGYYEDIDRKYDPVAIYPDFIKKPVYTSDGYPFITLMQSPCEHFERKSDDDDCGSCNYMERGDDLIAICRCPKRRI